MGFIPKTYQLIKNKYFVVLAFFIIWMSFFDPKDWGLIIERTKRLTELEKSEQQFSSQISETRAELNLLKSDAQSVERYAREKYLMKKDNEVVFVVKTTEKK